MIPKKRIFLLISLTIMLLFLASTIIILTTQSRRKYSAYIYNYEEIPLSFSDNNKPREIYNTVVAKSVFINLANNKKDREKLNSELQHVLAVMESSFEKHCSMPELCDPLDVLGGYCVGSKALNKDKNWQEIRKKLVSNPKFVNALIYWRDYFGKSTIREDELEPFYGYLIAEKECGNAEKLNEKEIALEVLKTEIQTPNKEKYLKNLKKKAIVLATLFNGDLQEISVKNSEIASEMDFKVCKNVREVTLENQADSPCFARDYLILRKICKIEPIVEEKYEKLFKKLVSNNYKNVEDILCQGAIVAFLNEI